jgi:predicted RNA-binding Zn ribbon-like protein
MVTPVHGSSAAGPDPASAERSDPRYRWDFCGGELAIDFTNTVGSRGAEPAEHFRTYGDVVSWLETRGVVSAAAATRLRKAARADPPAARRAVARALELREALYRTIAARAEGRPVRDADLETLNGALGAALSRTRLAPLGDRLALVVEDERGGIDAALNPVVRAAVELLTGDAIARVHRCGDPACAWLFLDTTRNGRRRWCDMNTCGNRAKVRRFRDRQE